MKDGGSPVQCALVGRDENQTNFVLPPQGLN